MNANGYVCQSKSILVIVTIQACGSTIHQTCLASVLPNCLENKPLERLRSPNTLVRVKSIEIDKEMLQKSFQDEDDEQEDADNDNEEELEPIEGFWINFIFHLLFVEVDDSFPLTLEEKDQVGTLLQLIRSRANVSRVQFLC